MSRMAISKHSVEKDTPWLTPKACTPKLRLCLHTLSQPEPWGILLTCARIKEISINGDFLSDRAVCL